MTDPSPVRINKFLSEAGFCSRRQADALVEQGRVTINGQVPAMGTKVAAGDVVAVDDEVVGTRKEEPVYIAFHKPVGIVCTTDTRVEPDNIIDFIDYPTRIFPIGRLDKMSEGLIFLTNDGDIVNKILRVKYGHEKEYIVDLNRPVTDRFVREMAAGVQILDTVTEPCEVEQCSKYAFRITLKQGLNRQIRRMCEALGYRVARLRRVRIMNVTLDLPKGHWRDLTAEELAEIRKRTAKEVPREIRPASRRSQHRAYERKQSSPRPGSRPRDDRDFGAPPPEVRRVPGLYED